MQGVVTCNGLMQTKYAHISLVISESDINVCDMFDEELSMTFDRIDYERLSRAVCLDLN